LTNLSLSGAFVVDLDLRHLSPIQVAITFPSRQITSIIPAYVVRQSAVGSGIEWCEWAPAAITQLLRAIGSPDPAP
jgi:hypothetical protein